MIDSINAIYYNRALEYISECNITEAVKVLEGNLEINNDDYKAMNLLGLAYYRLGEFNRAKSIWNRSIGISKDNLANEYLIQLEDDDFKNYCDMYNEAITYLNQGEYKKCSKYLKKREIIEKKIVSSSNLLGLCMYLHGNARQASMQWRNSLELDCGNKEAINYLNHYYLQDKKKYSLISKIKSFINMH